MVTIRKSDNDYHLRVVSHCGDPESRRFERRVDDFLEDLYNVVPGRPTIPPPLAFSECKLSEHDGRQVVLIRFQLSPSWAQCFTLDDALSGFCERIFKPNAFSIARTLSSRSILGLSALSGTFQRMWNDSLYRQILGEREEFLRRIEEGFNDEYLPDWALASSFATFTGAIFLGGLTKKESSSEKITSVSISDCIAIATSILVNYSTRVELANPNLQQTMWDASHRGFKQEMEKVMHAIRGLTVSQNDNPSRINEDLYADLCEHLYGAMAAAAVTHIANRELFLAYVELRKEAHKSMIRNEVISLATIITSAFSVMTTTTALPISQWGLAEAVGWLVLGETPLVQTMFCPQLAPVLLGGAVYFNLARYQNKKKKELFAKKVDYHRKLKAFIVQAWMIAHITHASLRLVRCITADQIEFVNYEARSEWRNIITKFNEARGRATPRMQHEAGYIVTFLDEQRGVFEAWQSDLAAHESQIV